MKQIINYIQIGLVVLTGIVLLGCEGFLDEKPSKNQVIPRTVSELEGLLNANGFGMNQDPTLGHMATDDFQVSPGGFMQLNQLERNSYLWEYDPFLEEVSGEWAVLYKHVYNANLVLEGLQELENSGEGGIALKHAKGFALFVKAQAYYFLLQAYAAPYVAEQALRLRGIPLRNTTDINVLNKRSTLEESYQETENRLLESLDYLPERDETRKKPSQWAAHALLSRIYLIKGEYQKALDQSELALGLGSELIDYNELDPDAAYPFPEFDKENIYNVTLTSRRFWSSTGIGVNWELYESYDSTDLRKSVFFNESPDSVMLFKGDYTGNHERYAGYGVDELYLTKAECLTRLGKDEESREIMESLLTKRYKSGFYESNNGLHGNELLSFILEERRKQLLFRNIRWIDLRRLNRESEFQKTLLREVDGQSYMLEPGSHKYAFPIPLDEIKLNSLEQNPGYQ
ncbi:RagB/SusD family nutrient uptake outer membrane protein [Algoriphagus sp.]|uniref:RagB/SusD family nutrient uptake outer membrane protein n=1 Tax=Algoriphagus sp. TaxID=1872435 RepID=UPI00328F77AA